MVERPVTRSITKRKQEKAGSVTNDFVSILPKTTASSRRQQNFPDLELKHVENCKKSSGNGHEIEASTTRSQEIFTLLESKEGSKKTNVIDADGLVSLEEFSKRCSSETVYVNEITDVFNCEELLGEGTYGMVYKSTRKATGEVIALKNLRWESQDEGVPATSTREVLLLRELNHPRIVKLKEVIFESRALRKKNPRLWLEFEYCEMDLRKYMKLFEKRRIPVETIRSIIYQLLEGLAYVHSRRICHRDIKPNNILLRVNRSTTCGNKRPATDELPNPSSQRRRTVALSTAREWLEKQNESENCCETVANHKAPLDVSSRLDVLENRGRGKNLYSAADTERHVTDGQKLLGTKLIESSELLDCHQVSEEVEIKIADFGLARDVPYPLSPMTHEVVTLWYRAPEILLGLSEYTTAIDVWSIGCCLVELLYGRPIFAGDTEIDTLFKIFRFLGTPNNSLWPGIENYANYQELWPSWARRPDRYDWLREGEDIGQECKHLIDRLLCYNCYNRITAMEALNHPWFKPLLRKKVH